MPKFTVVIPCYSELSPLQEGAAGHIHYRGNRVQRAVKSVVNQQFPDWELIIVDDGCADDTPALLDKIAKTDKRIRVIHQVNQNRAIARNRGMEEAKGEWLCWLDSDDEYSTHYLRELDAAIQDFPEYKIFNFGSILHWEDHHTSTRPVFTPAIEGKGHEYFRSGHIGAGSFIFRKDLWETKGLKKVRYEDEEGNPIIKEEEGQIYRIPDEVNPYQFAAASLFPYRLKREEDEFKYDNTENPEEMFQDGVKRHGSSLGNPWGDDAIQFYLLTRDNLSKPLDVLLYIQYPRAHEERYEHYGQN
jgi:glycosyltransferase involved in cell wall biosynthesis